MILEMSIIYFLKFHELFDIRTGYITYFPIGRKLVLNMLQKNLILQEFKKEIWQLLFTTY
jgi:hypothetical protein